MASQMKQDFRSALSASNGIWGQHYNCPLSLNNESSRCSADNLTQPEGYYEIFDGIKKSLRTAAPTLASRQYTSMLFSPSQVSFLDDESANELVVRSTQQQSKQLT
ncbi:hypothetical protein CA13_44900 [Planctomycetes bacterium CA13]|uniref:Uncharacterized protein n=1 Tax=Novipirellula herctigrandis TaxID=2527986 RepID=A0A5C5Z7G8_9BACT|nr:hypothetical protein CA13_44900 [Planctomycetes bacterium CA13]